MTTSWELLRLLAQVPPETEVVVQHEDTALLYAIRVTVTDARVILAQEGDCRGSE